MYWSKPFALTPHKPTAKHKLSMLKHLGLSLLCLSLCSCTLLPSKQTPPQLPLLSPALLGSSWAATQTINSQLNGKANNLLIALSINPNEIDLVGLSSMGQRLISVHYDGSKITASQSQWLNIPIAAETVLSQLQLAYWPLTALKQNYPTPWQVSENICQRDLQLNNMPFVSIHYCDAKQLKQKPTFAQFNRTPTANSSIRIEQHRYQSTLTVKTIDIKESI